MKEKDIEDLIEEYKSDFYQKTGLSVEIRISKNKRRPRDVNNQIAAFWFDVIREHYGMDISTIRQNRNHNKFQQTEVGFMCKWLCYLLREEDLTYKEIGLKLNRNEVTCRQHYLEMVDKMRTDKGTQLQYFAISETKRALMKKTSVSTQEGMAQSSLQFCD